MGVIARTLGDMSVVEHRNGTDSETVGFIRVIWAI